MSKILYLRAQEMLYETSTIRKCYYFRSKKQNKNGPRETVSPSPVILNRVDLSFIFCSNLCIGSTIQVWRQKFFLEAMFMMFPFINCPPFLLNRRFWLTNSQPPVKLCRATFIKSAGGKKEYFTLWINTINSRNNESVCLFLFFLFLMLGTLSTLE